MVAASHESPKRIMSLCKQTRSLLFMSFPATDSTRQAVRPHEVQLQRVDGVYLGKASHGNTETRSRMSLHVLSSSLL